jgi:hypothetical protein
VVARTRDELAVRGGTLRVGRSGAAGAPGRAVRRDSDEVFVIYDAVRHETPGPIRGPMVPLSGDRADGQT